MLGALLNASCVEVVGLVTQPDRSGGRNRRPMACACKAFAEPFNIPMICPVKVNHPEVLAQIRAWDPEVIIVVAFGQFLGAQLLAMPRFGCINIHLSLLPKYRGAAPVQWAIANGERETGVTAMLMDEGMDSGDILAQATEPILPDDTSTTLHTRLAHLGGRMLCDILPRWVIGRLPRQPQRHDQVTFAPKLRKEDGILDWHASARTIDCRVRAFNPWPACHTWLPRKEGVREEGRRLKILRVAALPGYVPQHADLPAGSICETASGRDPLVRVGDGAVQLLEVQPEAGRVMSGQALACGYRLQVGNIFA